MKLFELMATLGLDTGDFEKGINNSYEKANSFMGNVGRKLADLASSVGKGIAVGAGALAAGFTAATKQAFDLYGPLEQNLGGAVAVFGEYADEIQEKAAKAAQNMGASMTDYLAAINQMGSLAQGAGFSMEASAEMSAEAMQRAADVASIMGLSSERAMESVAGMFKGNFTMMDNLGVAINDAAIAEYALAQGISKSTKEMNTQEKVSLAYGLFMERTAKYAGNYRKENETLSGSIEVLHAAWDNFLLGTDHSAEQLVISVENVAKASFDAIREIAPRLWDNFVIASKIALPKIETAWANLWDNTLPSLATNGANLVIDGVNSVLGTNIPHIDTIDFPKWEELKTSVSAWWSTTSANISNVTQWTLKHLGILPWTDEDTADLREWWDGVYDTIVDVCQWMLDPPLPPSADAAIEAITSWWNGVRSSLSLTFSVRPEIASYQATKESAVQEIGLPAESFVKNSDSFFDWGSIFGSLLDGSHASGLGFVPYNGYVSELHYGEVVLPRQAAEEYRASRGGGGADTAALLSAIRALGDRIERMSINLDGKRVGHMVASTVNEDIAWQAGVY